MIDLEPEEVPADNVLALIERVAGQLEDERELLLLAERQLDEQKERTESIQRHLFELLAKARQKKLTTSDGLEIELDEKRYGNISAERKAEAHAWLRQHGHGAVIKAEFKIQVPRGKGELIKKIEAYLTKVDAALNINHTLAETVHHETLGAIVREELKDGTLDAEGEALLGVYPKRVIRLKRKNGG